MKKGRLEAFSDGVIAILITIMVLGFSPPREPTLAALLPLAPTFLTYLLSFVFLGIYWNNHHHLLQAVDQVDGRTLWANLHLLFWLSLVPFGTAWLDQTNFAALPMALYGAISLLAGVAYYLLTRALVSRPGVNTRLATAVGNDFKARISLILYMTAMPVAFLNAWLAYGLYWVVALIWLIPDRRIEKTLAE